MSELQHPDELEVESLGAGKWPSPLVATGRAFMTEGTRVLMDPLVDPHATAGPVSSAEKAGPRERIFFDPAHTTAALVTCGGISPGLNNVIRSAYLELAHNYGVPRILGIRNGYAGLNPASGFAPIELTAPFVENIHNQGGTVLGSSRGPQEPSVVVDFLEAQNIDALLCIGGDGTLRGAHRIHEEIERRGLPKSVVGIPKTIDNDVPFVWLTFGHVTALEVAAGVIRSAHVEATGAPNGVGVVKLMGRDAGFIAVGAALASQDANFVLVPEVEFPLDGFLEALEQRIASRQHAVVVVAEGAGQHLFESEQRERDTSGNLKHQEIGSHLCACIKAHFAERGIPLNLKYIDPSYVIRSQPANAWDRVLTDRMARNAVHAAMAGKTDVLIGFWNQAVIHVPIEAAVRYKRQLPLQSDLWSGVLATTGQPHWPARQA